jgi:hypothetical protein
MTARLPVMLKKSIQMTWNSGWYRQRMGTHTAFNPLQEKCYTRLPRTKNSPCVGRTIEYIARKRD